jgi:hypothetical protein
MSLGKVLVLGIDKGGGNRGSIATLKAFSIILGMILASKGLDSSKQGLLLT